MTQKLASLSKLVAGMDAEQRALWKESLSNSAPVLRALETLMTSKINDVEKDMRLDAVLKQADPGAAMLSLQAKKEAYQELVSLIVDK
jgi:hypothetical protein